MKVLVVGGTGIISTAVVNECIEKGHNLTIINRGRRNVSRYPNVKNVVADVRKESLSVIKKKIGILEFDVVIDFLSYTLDQLKKTTQIADCRQYIFISSSSIYEENNSHVYSEDSNKGNKEWRYCKDKYECECRLPHIAKGGKFHYTIIRPYVTYSNHRFPYQFCPLEYYSMIYRVAHCLPIPIINKDYITTITDSRDFAKGLVGLIGNEKAYDTDFNITSDNHVRWKDITDLIAEKYGVKCNYVELRIDDIKKHKNTVIDVQELLYDKSRMMTFDNTKIKNAVPGYNADRRIEESIVDILNNFSEEKNPEFNYIWTGCLDRLIYKNCGIKTKAGSYKYTTNMDKLKYLIGRSEMLCFMFNIVKIIRHKL